MDAFECIATKLDVKEFSSKPVPDDVKKKILEAARLTGSGRNIQHWRFVLVQEPENLKRVLEGSVTGKWVSSANFAVIVLTDPQYNFHMLDAGRVLQDMEVAAWNFGVASRFYTTSDKEAMMKNFNLPKELNLTAVLGFGYPAKKVIGRKDRKPLSELAFSEKYGQPLKV
ncbi:MAG TPA: nitroreductase family protein [Nitrososphaerales archaeon]|nr:nitroreductase family protein [Nitrososphaerales archaeon]